MVDCFPRTIAADAVARQLANSAPSVAANYRGTCNARSRKEFIAKLGVVVDESDESELWLTISARMHLTKAATVERFRREAVELRNIFAKSLGTARANPKLAKKAKNTASAPVNPITR